MKATFCIFALVLATFTNAAPPVAVHNNGLPPVQNQGYPYSIDPNTGYPIMPAMIPQAPPAGQAAAAAAPKNDLFNYLGNVPVVGQSLSKSSPQALDYLENSIDFSDMDDS